LACGTRPGRDDLAAVQHDQGGDALDLEPPRDRRGSVDVDLHELEPAGLAPRQRFHRRADRTARAAPRRPEIDQDRDRGFLGDVVEGLIGRVDDPRQWTSTLAALGHAVAGGWDAVLAPTARAD